MTMDGFFRFMALAAGMAVIALTLRGAHKEMGAVFAVIAGAALMVLLLEKLREAVDALCGIAQNASLDAGHIGMLLRVLGVSMLAEFAAQACRDVGEEGIALRVELGGKVMLAVIAMPLLTEISSIILDLTT